MRADKRHQKFGARPDLDAADIRNLLRRADRDEVGRFFSEEADLSSSTARNYRAAWVDFADWCDGHGREPLPASSEVVAEYLDARSSLAMSTIRNRLTAIRFAHWCIGAEDPTATGPAAEARSEISDEKRTKEGKRSPTEKLPGGSLSPSEIIEGGLEILEGHLSRVYSEPDEGAEESGEDLERQLKEREKARGIWLDPYVSAFDTSIEKLTDDQRQLIPEPEFELSVLRDRVVLMLMAMGEVSRTDITRMDLVDVFVDEGQIVAGIRKKNGMPDSIRRIKPEEDLAICPARALSAWIVGAGLEGGPLFRAFDAHGNMKESRIAPSSINLLIKKAAENAGLNPDEWNPSDLKDQR
jgi:hypothetical protein